MKAILKPVFLTAFVTFSAFSAVLYTSCKQDKCRSIVCAYGGSCNEGTCKCMPGYEGVNCETITNKKFIGRWQVHEKGSITAERQYPIAIENTGVVTMVSIKNIYNYFGAVKANIQGDTIIIPNQEIQGKVIFGKGYIFGTTAYGPNTAITIRYEVIDVASGLVDDFGYYADLNQSDPSQWSR